MTEKFTVYQMKKQMRKNNEIVRKQEKIFKSLINSTLEYNFIEFICKEQYMVTIPDFCYKPKLDLVYQLHNKKINIEIDGPYHDSERQEFYDKYRDAKLIEFGWVIHRLKSWRYERFFEQKTTWTFDVFKKYYMCMFEELEYLFSWKNPLPDNYLLKVTL